MRKSCAHKTIYHHVVGAVWDPKPKMYLPPKPWTYTCSVCAKAFQWTKDSELYGSMECEKCGFAVMDAVVCSEACRAKYDDLLKVRASERRTASRASRAQEPRPVRAVRGERHPAKPLLDGGNAPGNEVRVLPVQCPDKAPAHDVPPATFQAERKLIPTLGNRSLSPAEICRQNGWGPGTMLVGREDDQLDVIYITALGEEMLIARRMMTNHKPNPDREAPWTLDMRDWKEVDNTV